jgi:putative YphP/YqiW family bacilliredoxin
MIAPLRQEMTRLGAQELRAVEDVDTFLDEHRDGALVVINSVCGCSAGSMRPALDALHRENALPAAFGTVFAGADLEATERVRSLHAPVPPSSPAIIYFREGKPAFMLQRHEIQGKAPELVAEALREGLSEAAVGS